MPDNTNMQFPLIPANEGGVPDQGLLPDQEVFPGQDVFLGQALNPAPVEMLGQDLGPAPAGEQGQQVPLWGNIIIQDADFIPDNEIGFRQFARQIQHFHASGLDNKNRRRITPGDIRLAKAMEPDNGPLFFRDGTNWPADWMVEEGNGVGKEVADGKALEFEQGLYRHRIIGLGLFPDLFDDSELDAAFDQTPQ